MRKALVIAVLLVLMAGSTGCSSVGTYFKDRAFDFMDMTGIKICAGKGIRVGFEIGHGVISPTYELFGPDLDRVVTPPGLMFGYHDLFKFGYQGRAAGSWRDRGISFAATVDRNLKARLGNTFLFEQVDEYNEIYKAAPERAVAVPLDYPQYKYHYILDFTIAMVLFVGLEVDISIFQMFDFFVGIFGIDIAYDDARNRFYQEEEETEEVYDVRPGGPAQPYVYP